MGHGAVCGIVNLGPGARVRVWAERMLAAVDRPWTVTVSGGSEMKEKSFKW